MPHRLPRTTVVALLVYCLSSGCDAPNLYVEPPPPTVTVSPPVQQEVVEYLEFTGTTEAVAHVEVRARVKGFLHKIHFEEGDVVSKDDLLFTIDPVEYRATVNQAQAAVEVAQSGFKLAEATYKRTSAAVEKNAVSVLDGLEAEARRDEAWARVKQRQAELEKATLDLGYTEIRASMSGRVGQKLVDEGNLVGASDYTHLTSLIQYDPIYATFDISERDLLALMERTREERKEKALSPEERLRKLRQIPAEMGLANDDGYPHQGRLYYIDQGVESGTGTLLMKAMFSNPPPIKIYPGLFVRVRIACQEPRQALLVPERALGSDQSGRYVLVVNDGNITRHRSIVPGQKLGTMRVITSGLGANDRVIVNGLLRARPGAKVTPVEATPPSGQSAQNKGN